MKSAITSIAKAFIVSVLMVAQVHFAFSQTLTSSILPPAKTTFFDQNGKPLTLGTVDFYIPGSTVRKTTWQDNAQTIPNTNPVVLDNAGRALILGSGNYREIVKDRAGNLIWDQVTSSTGSSSGGGSTATGDGDLVGTIKPWAGMVAPNQYVFTFGQEVSRVTFATLLTAITSLQPISCTTGSPILSGLTDTTNFWIGMAVETSCLASGASTIISKTSTAVTLAANSNVTTGSTATFFPWGRGNGTTTFNIPDLRGQVLAGNNNMGGTASSNLDTTTFGSQTPNATGASGGNKSAAIALTNLPTGITSAGTTSITSTGTNSITVISGLTNYASGFKFGNGSAPNTGPITVPYSDGPLPLGSVTSTGSNPITVSGSTTTSVTSNNTGGVAFPLIQPTKMTNYIIKVTPDSNATTASGVTSIASMTGDIACGFGLLCTGNNLSVNNLPAPTAIIKGGVFSSTCSSNNWFNTLDTTGAFGCSQPAFSSLTGTATYAQIQNGTGLSVLGVTGNAGTANADIVAASDNTVLRRSGTSIGFGTIPSAALNITATSCTNQIVTAISATGVGTCSSLTFPMIATGAVATAAQYLAGTSSELVQAGVIYQGEVAVTFGATTTFDFNTFINASETLTANVTTQTLSNVTAGKAGTIAFIQDGTGSRTTVWNSIFKWAGGITPALTTTAAAVDVLSYSCRSATFCVASLIKDVR